jgi:hypothetical protein
VKLLDYQTQQQRVILQIARAFAYLFTGDRLLTMYHQVTGM